MTAIEYIPRMYAALRNEDANISPQDATDRIEKDCFGIWSKRTILDALPDEAKNPEKQKSGRLGQRNFAAVYCSTKSQRNHTRYRWKVYRSGSTKSPQHVR